MGLDMFLSKRFYVPQDKRKALSINGLPEVTASRVEGITEECGYWRKANAIHRWFVEHVQGGEDDCKDYWVDRGKLEELLTTVETVLASCELVDGTVQNGMQFANGQATAILQAGKVVKDPTVAKSLLPTAQGFFFGSAEYDQYYVEDLQETKRILTEALESDDSCDFYYQASW